MLQFAKVFSRLRKTHALTQEQIAQYVGVSKAAVSKWETGLSYPDILLLPKLATYLNVSIDTLLGYQPQMTAAQIREIYQRLAHDFATKPFDDVYQEITQLTDEYYSCFALINELNVLLLNYVNLAPQKDNVLAFMLVLCERIQGQSEDFMLLQQARSVKAFVYLQREQPDEVLQLLGTEPELRYGLDHIIANAYAQQQNVTRANEVLQVSLYQQIVEVISSLTYSLSFQLADEQKFAITVKRIEGVIEVFQLRKLTPHHPLTFYIVAAQGFMQQRKPSEALRQLKQYVELCQHVVFPFELRGDAYFDAIEGWLNKNIVRGSSAPRDDKSIKDDMYRQIAHNPAFEPLQAMPDFRQLMYELQQCLQKPVETSSNK